MPEDGAQQGLPMLPEAFANAETRSESVVSVKAQSVSSILATILICTL